MFEEYTVVLGQHRPAPRRAVYVLHCFQKKLPAGSRTAQTDIDLISPAGGKRRGAMRVSMTD